MTWIISILLLLVWALAVVSERTLGGAAHVLLVAAVVLMSVRLFRVAHRPIR